MVTPLSLVRAEKSVRIALVSMVVTSACTPSFVLADASSVQIPQFCLYQDSAGQYYDAECPADLPAPINPIHPVSPISPIAPAMPPVSEVPTISHGDTYTSVSYVGTDGHRYDMAFQKPPVILASSSDIRNYDLRGHWAELYGYGLIARGVVGNGEYFSPEKRLTRAEFIKIVMNAAQWKPSGEYPSTHFYDVSPNTWYAPYVKQSIIRGLVSSSNSYFRPNDSITRAEVAKMLVTMFNGHPSGSRGDFIDLGSANEFTPYAEMARDMGFFSGEESAYGLKFRPNDSITRGEIAKVVATAFGL